MFAQKKMKVFVTGADGMLGTCVCIELIKQQYEVVAFVLASNENAPISKLSITQKIGNVLDQSSIEHAMEGADCVIHIAASTVVWPRKNEKVMAVNLLGTQNVTNAAKKLGIKRMVHIGSASSFTNGNFGDPGNEESLIEPQSDTLDYVTSKLLAQQWLVEESKKSGFPVVIVCPTFMIGPFDTLPSSGRILQTYFNGKLPAYTAGGKNFVNTEDVAVAVVNALVMGEIGQCYIAGNVNLSFEEFLKKAAKSVDKPFRLKKAPAWLTLSVGFVQSAIARVTNRAPLLSYSMAKSGVVQQVYSADKAVKVLKMPQQPIEVGIQKCYNWFKENGKVS
jgi:dihydroflavonol-4-reductase